MSVYSASASVRSVTGVNEFDDFIASMKAYSQKERAAMIATKQSTQKNDEFDDFLNFLQTPAEQ